ncbi:MAG: DUF2924 domain-containing protein [Alphaproteobacteria bacterium]
MNEQDSAAGSHWSGSGSRRFRTRKAGHEIERQLAELFQRPTSKLKVQWRELYKAVSPPRLSRDLLIRGIGYRMQEQAAGGPDLALQRRLTARSRQAADGKELNSAVDRSLQPGTRLVREWHGKTHTVMVLDDGLEYQGQRYRSLSQIAKAITGGHWSGPRFFGLKDG